MGEWSENPDADDYREDSIAYSSLLTLTAMWENRPDDRKAIECLVSVIISTADRLGYYENINMDLYNNYIVRNIAWNDEKSHWYDNSKEELSTKVEFAANNGYLVILR